MNIDDYYILIPKILKNTNSKTLKKNLSLYIELFIDLLEKKRLNKVTSHCNFLN